MINCIVQKLKEEKYNFTQNEQKFCFSNHLVQL
jgi:hypothetical protein